jgi:hypothetical protein
MNIALMVSSAIQCPQCPIAMSQIEMIQRENAPLGYTVDFRLFLSRASEYLSSGRENC